MNIRKQRAQSRSAFLFFVVLALLGQPLSAQVSFTGTTMGPIEYNVSISDEVVEPAELEAEIKQRLEQINGLMSTYIASSEVSQINVAKTNQWIDVDPLTLHVIKQSLELSRATGGAFDITVGPAVGAWSFGEKQSDADSMPSSADIEQMRTFVGYEFIETREEPPAIRKKYDNTRIDLSAIAKGFAVDCVAELLEEKSFKNFMVEVGGEVFASGMAETGRQWRIGIELPVSSRREVSKVVLLKNLALATSGDYRNFKIIDGKKYSYTIDPKTCRPVQNQVASVSVVAKNCLTADALATAIMVTGMERGKQICKSMGAELMVYTHKEDDVDSFDVASTDAFPVGEMLPGKAAAEEASIWPAFLGALVIFGLAITGMAVGSIFNNRPIRGSCGGVSPVSNDDGSTSCSLCEKPVAQCPDRETETSSNSASV